jgi:hypothetical protein
MLIAKPMTLGLISRVAFLRRRNVLVIGATAAFRLDDPSRLILEAAFWKAAAPALDGAVLDMAMPKPQGEVLLAGFARAPGERQTRPPRVSEQCDGEERAAEPGCAARLGSSPQRCR